MTPVWDDVNARVHGLRQHLLTSAELEALAREPDLIALSEALRRRGVVNGEVECGSDALALELAVRRWAAAMLGILARWAGNRTEALPLVFDAEDRRSIRAIVRGAAQHVPAEARLSGLIPTPTLPERALETLASAPTAAAVVSHLSVWHHPFATALLLLVGETEPDLFAIEAALAAAAAARAVGAARRSRDALLQRFVAESIDLDNAITAITLATEGTDVVPRDLFLTGGARLRIDAFEEAIVTQAPGLAGLRLAKVFVGTAYGDLLAHGAGLAVSFEDELLRCRLRELRRQVRMAPLGPIGVEHFALSLRAQVIDLQRIIWLVSLALPGTGVRSFLATIAT